ncbi:low-density lipoprotein receptor-related protein 4-like [Lytechinus variegatus]|uniref:low-density lipoprotein receptor-related protein 4-like n=1 Tax=Lytechinus variegatus TaxID=7654 RepID=UPI001BB130AD|nr:low-density lipoprotein receptor-related protein 4-like [Lytechinus variegatus]
MKRGRGMGARRMIIMMILVFNVFRSDGLIYEARVNQICSFEFNETAIGSLVNQNCFITNLNYGVAVAADRSENILFYSDISTLEIRSYNTETLPAGNGDRILYGFGSVEDMAVDWVAKNLYTADQSFRQIAVSRYDGSMRAVLIQDDVGKPRSIALHPERGLMFWADYGGLPSLERANLDGTDRTTIVDANIQFPNGLAIDFDNSIIYFADRGSDNIASVDFDGGNRQLVHYQYGGDFFDMVLVRDHLFVTSWTSGQAGGHITTISNVSDANQAVDFEIIDHNTFALGITTDDEDTQPVISSPCTTNNGGCQELCFPLANAESSCGCSSGFTLNGVTCESTPYEDDFVLVADSAQKKIFQVPIVMDAPDGDTGLGNPVDDSVKALPLDDLEYPIALTYDPVLKHVYWTDLTYGSITKAAIDGSFKQTIVFDNNVHVGIAIDTARRRIYWTDEDRDVIEVANLDGSGRQIIIQNSLNEPRGITVDIQTGDLYWTDWGSAPKIEKASSSGTRREILITENLNFPNGITIDPTERILYWCDSNHPDQSKIEQYNLVTLERSTIATLPSPSQPYGVTIHGDFIYWSDWVKNAVYRVDRFVDNPLSEVVGEGVMLGMQGIVSSQIFEVVTTLAPPVTQPDIGGQARSAVIPAVVGAVVLVVVIIIAVIVGVLCFRRSKENRSLAQGHRGGQSNDYRARPAPPKCAEEPPPLPGGHPNDDPLYMDLDAFKKDPPPPYTELNLNQPGGSGEQSYENPSFDAGAANGNISPSPTLYDMPDGMAPPPPGVTKDQMAASGGYVPYLKNNAEQEGFYMTPDGTAGTTDSLYEVANA